MIFGNVLFFEGCTIRYALKEIGEKYRKLLRNIGIDFIEIEEPCCGFPLLSAGALRDFEEHEKKIKKLFKEYWVKKAISPCPACVCAFKEMGINAEHVVEIFYRHLKKKRLEKKIEKRVYLHYPCHSIRYLNLGETFLELSKMLFTEIIDPSEKKCCGGGGGLRTNFPEVSREIAKKRVMEVKNSRAEAILTCCPLCYVQLKEVGKLEVIELSEALIRIL